MSWVDQMLGTWSADDLRRAFVEGAAWWEYQTSRASMWGSDRREAETEAELRYPGGKPPAPTGYEQSGSFELVRETCPRYGADDAPDALEDC